MTKGPARVRYGLASLAPQSCLASIWAMTTWHMAVVDAWIILITASIGVLPEDLAERCRLDRMTVDGQDRYMLHVDGSPVGIIASRVTVEGDQITEAITATPPPYVPTGGWVAYLRDERNKYPPSRGKR